MQLSRRVGLLVLIIVVLINGPAPVQADWALEVFGGFPVTPARTVHIKLDSGENIELYAPMKSKPFKMPFYYDQRLIHWSADGKAGWALDFMHHKLILKEPTDDVQDFQLTNGYNMLTVQRLWKMGETVLMAGAGIVITHPESTIHWRTFRETGGLFNWGYFPSGPVAIVGAGRQLRLSDMFYVAGDVRGSLSYVDVPVVEGRATMTDVSLHFFGGVGVVF